MQDIATKVEGSQLTAEEFNQIPSELENTITSTGQSLSSADVRQLVKAIATYSGSGDFYSTTGTANAIILNTIGSMQAPVKYSEGLRVRFKVSANNTSAVNISISGLSSVKLLNAEGGDLASNELVANKEYSATFDGTNFRLFASDTSKVNLNLDNSTVITNCITAIPQDIKLELNNGTLTLKAGSKVYDGNGLFKDISSDLTLTPSDYFDIPHVTFVKEDGTLYARALVDCASGTTVPSSGFSLYYNENDKKVYQVDSGAVIGTASFPLCVFSVSGGVATSIDQVFNGFGYIGNTLIKNGGNEYLFPNGRNADGSLNNIKKILPTLTTWMIGLGNNISYTLLARDSGDNRQMEFFETSRVYKQDTEPTPITYSIWYSLRENKWRYILADTSNGWLDDWIVCEVATFFAKDNCITSFTPKNTFQAVDRNELKLETVKKIAYESSYQIDLDGEVTYSLKDTDEILAVSMLNNGTLTIDISNLSFTKEWYTVQFAVFFPSGAKTLGLNISGLQASAPIIWINGNAADFSDMKTHWIVLRINNHKDYAILSDAGTEG